MVCHYVVTVTSSVTSSGIASQSLGGGNVAGWGDISSPYIHISIIFLTDTVVAGTMLLCTVKLNITLTIQGVQGTLLCSAFTGDSVPLTFRKEVL